MNKKNISMIAMIACIVFTAIYSINQLLGLYTVNIGWGIGSFLVTILKFLSGSAFNVFWILFFRCNYMEKDDRKISLFAGISAFVAAFFQLIWQVSWWHFHIIGYYHVFCFIALGIFLIFNYSGKSKKIISLVLAIMLGISFIFVLMEMFFGISFLYGNTLYLILNTSQYLALLFVTIIEILFFTIIYRSYPKVDKDKEGNLSIGDWMLMMFLVAIPIVGLVMLFLWAFESNPHPIKSNWAKANLIWGMIMMLLSLFIILIVVLATIM